MKKLVSVLCIASLITIGRVSHAAYSQYNIYTSIEDAHAWIEKTAAPLSSNDYAASDYYMMAVARMGYDYDYNAYITRAQSRVRSTYTDGQRMIMAATACGSAWSGDTLKEYTYKELRGNAAELAGALITLDCGRYEIPDQSNITRDHIMVSLLAMQQSDGSFEGDIYTTARALTALSPYVNNQYKLSTGEHKNAEYTYNTQSAILNAIAFLESAKGEDFGYGTVTNTANVIIALDAAGINADADPAFSAGGASPLQWLKTQQKSNGSFNDSAYDTSLAMCAMTSHLRAMQGLSSFYDFSSGDAVDISAAQSGNPKDLSGDESKTEVTEAVVIEVTPPADDAAEDADASEPPNTAEVKKSKPAAATAQETQKPEPPKKASGAWAIVIISAIILFAAGIAFIITGYGEQLKAFIRKILNKS